jgi:hypothetical protein
MRHADRVQTTFHVPARIPKLKARARPLSAQREPFAGELAVQPRPRAASARAGALVLSALLLSACGSGEAASSEPEAVESVTAAVMARGWKSLNGANHTLSMDVATHLGCSGDPNGTADQVRCFRPNADNMESSYIFPTNWGTTPTNGQYRIAGGAVKSVALLRRAETNVPRPNAGYYEVFVLSADNVVRYTAGNSDITSLSGNDFKSYTDFVQPKSSDGKSLYFRKIMWMNEDSLASLTGSRYLFALTYDGSLYRTGRHSPAWTLHTTGIKDMGDAGPIGATFLAADGRVWYDRFSDDPYDFSGFLPAYPGANITAVGGLYALTDYGKGGNCDTSGCNGDDRRVIHFSWKKWKWEPLPTQYSNVQHPIDKYFPLASPQTCQTVDGTTACSPQVKDQILDPHGFGSLYNPNASGSGRGFDLGPFVGRIGSRIYYYNPVGYFPAPFHACMPSWNSRNQTYDRSVCGCAQKEDTDYCGVNERKSCLAGSCQSCGARGQPCCVGRSCPGSSSLVCLSDSRCEVIK